MQMIIKLAAAACALAAVPAMAAEPAAQAAVQAGGQAAPAAAPASSGTPSVAKNDIEKADPVVCERVTEIGSRLRAKKVCMTKSQWQEQRRGDRSNIERSQIQRGMDPVG